MHYDGKTFNQIKTFEGESFIDFHHKIFKKNFPNVRIIDASKYKVKGESTYFTYLKYFAVSIYGIIMFENYFVKTNTREREFTENVIKPSFKRITELFGLKPLIVPIISDRDEKKLFWQYYSEKVGRDLKIF